MRALFAAALLLPVVSLASEAKGPNRAFGVTGKPASPVEKLLDAARLAQDGRTIPQADLLIAAARVAAEANGQPSVRAKRTEGAPAPEGAKAPLVLDPAKLLEQASAAATSLGHLDLEKHIGWTRQKPLATGKAKSHYQTERVASGASDTFEIVFKGGEIAQVGILGFGAADLDLTVMDEQWNVICAAAGDTAREYCSWTPATTGTFRIRVKNQGPAPDDYVLATN